MNEVDSNDVVEALKRQRNEAQDQVANAFAVIRKLEKDIEGLTEKLGSAE